jgi:hypothetical protein
MAPNAAHSFNPISGFLPIPGVTDNPTFEAANKKLTQQIPGLSGINAVGDFAARLTEPNTWLRVAEVAIGALLLFVAVKAMFPGAVETVTAPVKTAAKVGTIAAA